MPNLKLLHGVLILFFAIILKNTGLAQGTRLLRQPSISDNEIAFVYGGDIWVVNKKGGEARRITSTAAVESDPHFSPDGQRIAFASNRSGVPSVYVVSSRGGTPTRLTWYPSPSYARGWSPDGKLILYASMRETTPSHYCKLWTVPAVDANSYSKGIDLQLQKAVEEVLKLLEKEPSPKVIHPEYSKSAKN
jgi:tricorn protease